MRSSSRFWLVPLVLVLLLSGRALGQESVTLSGIEYESLVSALTTARASLVKAQNELKTLNADLSMLENLLLESQEEASALRETCVTLSTNLTSLSASFDEYAKQVTRLETERTIAYIIAGVSVTGIVAVIVFR